MTKDGQTVPTANIPMGGFKLTGLGAGTSATDAAQFGQLQNAPVATLITVSGADTITGTLVQTLTAYATGQQFSFVAAGTNTTAVTLNIDGLGAKAVTRTGAVALDAGALVSGQMAIVEYDGTRFQLINANAFTNLTVSGALTVGTTLAVTGVATLTAQPILSSLTASLPVFTDASKGLVSNAMTGTGSVMMSASPTTTGTLTAAAINASGTVAMAGAATVGTTLGVTGTSTMAAINASGLVTINKGSTGEHLVVGFPGTPLYHIGNDGTYAYITTSASAFGTGVLSTATQMYLTVNNAATLGLTATAATVTGTLGVTGTVTIDNALVINGNGGATVNSYGSGNNSSFISSHATQPLGPLINYTGAAPNGVANFFLEAKDTGATRVQLRSNGGIGNYSANNVNLSDIRTKKDIQPAGAYLPKIMAIPVKTFLYKDQTDTALNLGVIAQDVEAVAPELIDNSGFGETPEDGIPLKAIYQTDLQYALMKAIQELAAEFQSYKNSHP